MHNDDMPPPEMPGWLEDDASNVVPFAAPEKRRKAVPKPVGRWVTGSPTELATAGLGDIGPRVMSHSGALWALQPDHTWRMVDTAAWSRVLQVYDGQWITETRHVRVSNATARDAFQLALDRVAVDPESIPVGCAARNGFVVMGTAGLTIRPLQPEDYQTAVWPVEYVEDEPTETWDDACRAWWPTGWENRQAYIETHFGLAYLGAGTAFERAMLLKGPAGNGKSVLIHALSGFVPAAAKSSVSPDMWADGTLLVALRGVRINLCTELADSERMPGDRLKAVVSGETLTVRPVYQQPFALTPIAGHVFAANPWPGVTDRTQGGWDRWAVVMMAQRFRGTQQEVPRKVLLHRLSMESSAIFSRCVRRAAEALESGHWAEPDWSLEAKEQWRQHSDPVAGFVSVRCDVAATIGPSVGAVFEAYRQFCAKIGVAPLSLWKFTERMEALGFFSVRGDSLSHYRLRFRGGSENW